MSRASLFSDGDDMQFLASNTDKRTRGLEAKKLAESEPDGFRARDVKSDESADTKKPGRPKGTTKAPTVQCNFHLRADLKELLDKAIEDEMGGAYKSAYLTRLVRQHLIAIGALEG